MAKPQAASAQRFVPIKEIRNGTVILKDGSLATILMASSLNFALKSYDEQTSILLQFQNFLNALDFSVQFYVQSRDLDIRPYVALLEERYAEQTNDLLRIQTREYIQFVKTFTENTDIMSKHFFIVVPYTPPVLHTSKKLSGVGKIMGKGKEEGVSKDVVSDARFEEWQSQPYQRVGVVEQGLVRAGVRVVELGTEELIELYYKIFNPGDLEKPVKLEA